MSSAEIMELIIEKEEEKEKLETTKTSVDEVGEVMDCISSKFSEAASAIENGSILVNNAPFDSGKTAENAEKLKTISENVVAVSGDLDIRILALQEEIDALYLEYEAALEREAEEASKDTPSTTSLESGVSL